MKNIFLDAKKDVFICRRSDAVLTEHKVFQGTLLSKLCQVSLSNNRVIWAFKYKVRCIFYFTACT